MTEIQFPTLGQTIRALRLGFAFAHRRGCWVRVTDAPGGFDVELLPSGPLPSNAAKGTHRVLRQPVDDLLDMDERLKSIVSVKKPISIFVADAQP